VFEDDSRSDEQRIESAAELSEIMRLRKVRAMIRAAAEKRREAGKTEPRSLGG
jgi:hypothetical protein